MDPNLKARESLDTCAITSDSPEKLPQSMTLPPKSWAQTESMGRHVIGSPWYQAMFRLQDSLYHTAIDFFRHGEQFRHIFAPLTTGSVSSPLGLGSDSVPVPVIIHNQNTYLSDSMQFLLEYFLRISDETRGTYHISTSFRGEDPDQMHLNQFIHIECEVKGGFEDAIGIAERFLLSISKIMLDEHEDMIKSIAGTTEHVRDLITQLSAGDRGLKRITLKEAFSLPTISSNPEAWEYIANDPSNGRRLTRVGENILQQEVGNGVWLTDMEHLSVPFYQAFASENSSPKTARCADLILGPGEIIGLGERHSTRDQVKHALSLHHVPEAGYRWYIDLRTANGGRDHFTTAGWGLGMERYFMWLLAHNDIRDIPVIVRLKDKEYVP